jgi:CheY-like chemotaxis protein/HPt (histidine-containing phosphotransfer) domain-containing protein
VDTGIGIAEDSLDKIFDKFVQADASTTRKYGGSGLGLAITRQLLELMGGSITAESELGEGSIFTIQIPMMLAEDTLFEDFDQHIGIRLQGSLPSAEARVLVAEDHELNQLYLRRFLPSIGITHFTVVDNGRAAVDAAMTGEFDIILMDCHMPVLNGYDATQAIRMQEQSSFNHIPIIAMTANALIGEREKCLRAGMDEYLSKPINKNQFIAVLSQWLIFDDTHHGPSVEISDIPVLDLTNIRTFTEGDNALEREFAAIFVAQSTAQLAALAECCVDGPAQAWVEQAHLLKGGGAGMGAMQLSHYAANAQEMFDSTAEKRAAILTHMKDAYAEAIIALKKLNLLD